VGALDDLTHALGRHASYAASRMLAESILKRHAHELAEEIRLAASEWDGWPEKQAAMVYAASQIDSEVQR
jgi:hypothetical protein